MSLALSYVSKLAQLAEGMSLIFLSAAEGTHGHQSQNLQTLQPVELIQQTRKRLRCHTALLGLAGAIDLHQNPLSASVWNSPIELDRKIRPVGIAYKELVRAWMEVLPTQSVCLQVPIVMPHEFQRHVPPPSGWPFDEDATLAPRTEERE